MGRGSDCSSGAFYWRLSLIQLHSINRASEGLGGRVMGCRSSKLLLLTECLYLCLITAYVPCFCTWTFSSARVFLLDFILHTQTQTAHLRQTLSRVSKPDPRSSPPRLLVITLICLLRSLLGSPRVCLLSALWGGLGGVQCQSARPAAGQQCR